MTFTADRWPGSVSGRFLLLMAADTTIVIDLHYRRAIDGLQSSEERRQTVFLVGWMAAIAVLPLRGQGFRVPIVIEDHHGPLHVTE